MVATFDEDIDGAIEAEGLDKAKEVMGLLDDQIVAANAALASRTVIIALLILTMELLLRAAIGEISVAGIKLKDLALAQKLLPAGLAYFYTSWLTLFANRRISEVAYDRMFRSVYPAFHKLDFEIFVTPFSTFRNAGMIQRRSGPILGAAIIAVYVPTIVVLFLALPILLVRYTVINFAGFPQPDLFVIGSTIVLTFLLLQGAISVISSFRLIP